jgi:hypothetical protein
MFHPRSPKEVLLDRWHNATRKYGRSFEDALAEAQLIIGFQMLPLLRANAKRWFLIRQATKGRFPLLRALRIIFSKRLTNASNDFEELDLDLFTQFCDIIQFPQQNRDITVQELQKISRQTRQMLNVEATLSEPFTSLSVWISSVHRHFYNSEDKRPAPTNAVIAILKDVLIHNGATLPGDATIAGGLAAAAAAAAASPVMSEEDRLVRYLLANSKRQHEAFETTFTKYRAGQKAFRVAVLERGNHKCMLTGNSVEEALEAAHIVPYSEPEKLRGPRGEALSASEQSALIMHAENGVVLRRDLHTLWDEGEITMLPVIDAPGHVKITLQYSVQTQYPELVAHLAKTSNLVPFTGAMNRLRQRMNLAGGATANASATTSSAAAAAAGAGLAPASRHPSVPQSSAAAATAAFALQHSELPASSDAAQSKRRRLGLPGVHFADASSSAAASSNAALRLGAHAADHSVAAPAHTLKRAREAPAEGRAGGAHRAANTPAATVRTEVFDDDALYL